MSRRRLVIARKHQTGTYTHRKGERKQATSNRANSLTPARTSIITREVRSRRLRAQSSLVISGSMEHALLVLAPDLSHVVVLIVGWSPAIVYAALVVVLSAVYPAYCS